MSFFSRFATMLLVLTTPALVFGRPIGIMAQTTTPQPLLQVKGTLKVQDDILIHAIDFHQHLALEHQIGDRLGESIALGNLGNSYLALGDYKRAIDFHEEHLEIAQRIDDRLGESIALGNLGNSYLALGDYERAIDFHEENLEIARQIGDRLGESSALGNLGLTYDALGDYRRAIDFHQESFDIATQTYDRQGEASALGNLGSTYHALGDYEHAIDFHQQSLDIKQRVNDRRGEANSFSNLGLAYHALGNSERAIDLHQQSLDIARQISYRRGEASALGNLGIVHHTLGNYERAIDFQQQSLDIKHQIGDRQGESIALHNLGVALLGLRDLTEAERYFQASAKAKESLYFNDLADANRLSLLDSQQQTYRLWQLTLMAQGLPETALEIAERGRAQALVTSMARSLLPQNDTLVLLPPLDLNHIQSIAAEQNATLVEYSVLPSGHILIWVIQPDGSLQSTMSDAASLDATLINVADIFARLGQSRHEAEPETPLRTLVRDTQTALALRGDSTNPHSQVSRQQLDNYLQELHKLLIAPIAQWLPDDVHQRVIFIPHRELFRVPFVALKGKDGQYLIQKHTILTAPSIHSLDLARQHYARIQSTDATEALIVGNPTLPEDLREKYKWQPLPGAETEARNVGNYLSQYLGRPTKVLYHNQATETLVKERLHDARFIHLATHGTLVNAEDNATVASSEDTSPQQKDLPATGLQYSSIPGLLALAASGEDDGRLTADELLETTINNPLNAELVVLSACQTGQGPITSDGVYGLSRTLLTAGVPTLVVSLWNASDHHTVGLMDEFYRQFLEEEQDKAQALRQAMLHMIEQGDDNPQYWAAFTLVGEAE